jgi:hypothetical protein
MVAPSAFVVSEAVTLPSVCTLKSISTCRPEMLRSELLPPMCRSLPLTDLVALVTTSGALPLPAKKACSRPPAVAGVMVMLPPSTGRD